MSERELPDGCFRSRRAIGSCWSTTPAERRRRDRRARSSRRRPISAPTRCRPPSGWRSSTRSRTPISRRSRRSAASGCWSALSGSPRCCCATCSNGGASWRCSAPSAIGRGHIFAIVVAENALLLGWGLAAGALCARSSRSRRRCSSAAAGCRRPAAALLLIAVFVGRIAIVCHGDAGGAADAAARGAEIGVERCRCGEESLVTQPIRLVVIPATASFFAVAAHVCARPVARGRELAAVARAVAERRQRREEPAGPWSTTENVAWKLPLPALVRLDADRLGRSHLPERRRDLKVRDGDNLHLWCVDRDERARCCGSGRSAAATIRSASRTCRRRRR